MIRLLLLNAFLLITSWVSGSSIVVKNISELNKANKDAVPGDIIILQNGEWKDVDIRLDCKGSAEKPVTFRAQTEGKVYITGNSQLRLGGSYIVIDGWYFMNGYAGDNTAVINFRINKDLLANNCRVTNCSINNFNNPKRMDDNNWVSFSGRNNRLDHCSFKDKKNMGVLLAVILDDDQSRQNFHSIDHNYFGPRPPLGSNGGEMIRVGVSQHCTFNSNTQITDNFFDRCDGETEIVSIKSGSNIVRNNIFKECQGGVVLRHGDNNIVEKNTFIGNNKDGTGGVRIINKGQWVINNYFYNCRGVDFRSPLSVMNGVPNSAAFRYVQVTDAVITGNTFVNCSSISFCEGSDKERSLPPDHVLFMNNTFYNDRDSILYRAYDNISGFSFTGNKAGVKTPQVLPAGFAKTNFAVQKNANEALVNKVYAEAGSKWFKKSDPVPVRAVSVNCQTVNEVYTQLARKEPVSIQLTGKTYLLDKPFIISKEVTFKSAGNSIINIETGNLPAVFIIAGNGNLSLQHLQINASGVKAVSFITSESNISDHYNLAMRNCTISNLNKKNGCEALFYAARSMIADSIVIRNSSFPAMKTDGIVMTAEKDDKGYYNAEKITLANNTFTDFTGTLINIYRGGNDESTMGPYLSFTQNKITGNAGSEALFILTGVQQTRLLSNRFTDCNPAGNLVIYKDIVRAKHIFESNTLQNSGKIEKNDFVSEGNNKRK